MVRADEPSVFTSHSVAGLVQSEAVCQDAAFASFRFSNAQAMRAVLLPVPQSYDLNPRLATSAFS